MGCRAITCPETEQVEVVEMDETPLGTLVLRCSRFQPACAVTCSRICAARFDLLSELAVVHLVESLDVAARTEPAGAGEERAALARDPR